MNETVNLSSVCYAPGALLDTEDRIGGHRTKSEPGGAYILLGET